VLSYILISNLSLYSTPDKQHNCI